MSTLLVIGYPDKTTAVNVLEELQQAEKDYLVDLDDAAVIVRNEKGKVKVITTDQSIGVGTISGMFWGTLIGFIFLVPIAGLVYGGIVGAVAGAINRLGIKDEFKKDFAGLVTPGTSAIMAVIRHATPDKIIEDLRPYGGTVLQTSLTHEAEEELMDALHGKERRKAA